MRILVPSIAWAPGVLACAGSGSATAGRDASAEARPIDSGEPSPTCPEAQPEPATACNVSPSVECSFGDPCSFDRFACRGGRWALLVADGAAPSVCPDQAPATGGTCASCGASYVCRYGPPGEGGETMTTSICSGGHWLTGTSAIDAGAGVETGVDP